MGFFEEVWGLDGSFGCVLMSVGLSEQASSGVDEVMMARKESGKSGRQERGGEGRGWDERKGDGGPER